MSHSQTHSCGVYVHVCDLGDRDIGNPYISVRMLNDRAIELWVDHKTNVLIPMFEIAYPTQQCTAWGVMCETWHGNFVCILFSTVWIPTLTVRIIMSRLRHRANICDSYRQKL